MDNLYQITPTPISVDEVIGKLADPAVGGIATFVGVVRGVTGAQDGASVRETLYLEYEAYPGMAEGVLAQVGQEVQERWPEIRQVIVVHRIGHLEIGDTAIVIALSASHRRQLFDALHYAIDRIKTIVPIWKKEVWADGAEWKSEL
jgi:molybdopterin synthase catalytic subunit